MDLVPYLKGKGFLKTRLNFHRRVGDSVQVINIQKSSWNSAESGSFYVNVGLAFDTVWKIRNHPIQEKPPEFKCHARWRINQLVPIDPKFWEVNQRTDLHAVSARLRDDVDKLLPDLDRIDSVATLQVHPWFKEPGMIVKELKSHAVS